MSDHAEQVGKALYLEFRKGVNTAQIIITPEGFDKESNYVPSCSWRRQISTWSPKKPWKCYENPQDQAFIEQRKIDLGSGTTLDDIVRATDFIEGILSDVSETLNRMVENHWELYGTPIVLDFSMEDLIDTKQQETPSALIRRIMRARKELEFADELINPEAE